MSKGSQDLAHFGSVRFQLLPCHPSHRKGEERHTAAMSSHLPSSAAYR